MIRHAERERWYSRLSSLLGSLTTQTVFVELMSLLKTDPEPRRVAVDVYSILPFLHRSERAEEAGTLIRSLKLKLQNDGK